MCDELLDEFANYVANLWSGEFHHCYLITRHRAWQQWGAMPAATNGGAWFCTSLSQAAEHYSWPEAPGLNFSILSYQLRCAVEAGDEQGALSACLSIFRWGGVANKPNDRSRHWLNELASSGKLCERLKEITNHLLAENFNDQAFDGNRILMNSAVTKIYAALSPDQLVIYDGRVGAALSLIARDFLYSRSFTSGTPDCLSFCWGQSRRGNDGGQRNERDPSDDRYCFPRLFTANGDNRHAMMMHRASRLLRVAATRIPIENPPALTQIERALFMIGYDVSRSHPCG